MGENISSFIPVPYSDYLARYQWLILGVGVFLMIMRFVNLIKQKKNSNRNRNDIRWKQHKPNIVRKDFESEQRQHQAITAIDKNTKNQSAELKALAQKVEWSALASGGSNFKTSYLHQSDQSRIEVLRSTGGKLFIFVFIAMGSIIPSILVYGMFKEDGFGLQLLFPLILGTIFTGVGILMLFHPKPRFFDKQLGWFWAGSKKLSNEQELSSLKLSARLNEIAAIQIIAERLSGKNSSYTSWEINLVSNDAKRLNVMDHGNQESILSDAQMLGEFLGVPVWENT